MLVDIHAHYYPRAYGALLDGFTGRTGPAGWRRGGPGQRSTDDPEDIAGRIALMDEAGVSMQVLSPAIDAPYVPNEAHAVQAARACNDAYHELVRRHPKRLASFVSLPLPHVQASLAEMRRGLDELGMVGVTMNCSVLGKSSAAEEFEPLYAEMHRRRAVLFYHPCGNGMCSPFITDYKFSAAAGTSMEDTAIVLHLMARRIPFRYPDIRIIVPHFGGLTPMLLERLDNQAPSQHPDLPEPPSKTARRLYYDTVGHGSHAALHCAWRAFGASQLVTGSDYPVLLQHEPYARTFAWLGEAGLPAEEVERILRNAAGLLALA